MSRRKPIRPKFVASILGYLTELEASFGRDRWAADTIVRPFRMTIRTIESNSDTDTAVPDSTVSQKEIIVEGILATSYQKIDSQSKQLLTEAGGQT